MSFKKNRSTLVLILLAGFLQVGGLESAPVRLAWDPVPDAWIAGYNVYRASEATGPFIRINDELLASPSFEDLSAEAGARYYYAVTSVAVSGQESETTPALEVEVPPVESRPPALQTLPERTVRSGQLVILPVHDWLHASGNSASERLLTWSQLEGPPATRVYEDGGAIAFLAPEVVQTTQLVFEVSWGDAAGSIVKVVVLP